MDGARTRSTIHAKDRPAADLDPELCAKIRASILLAGPLLARCGEITLPPPGGDVIGRRRLDTHFLALEQLGATFTHEKTFELRAKSRFKGADVFLDEPSVTATENALVAASRGDGDDDSSQRRQRAARPGPRPLSDRARRADRWHRHQHDHHPRRPTARIGGTSSTRSARITSRSARSSASRRSRARSSASRLPASSICARRCMGFARLGDRLRRVDGDDLIVPAKQSREIQADLGGHVPKLEDQPWPAFPADTMSIAIVTATQCEGLILIHEKMFESRLFFVDKLIGMGARIVLCDPHRALVAGPSALRGATSSRPTSAPAWRCCSPRCARKGTSTINNVGQIERGYERIDERLNALGASDHARGRSTEVTRDASGTRPRRRWRGRPGASRASAIRAFTTTRDAGTFGLAGDEPVSDVMAPLDRRSSDELSLQPRDGSPSARQVHGDSRARAHRRLGRLAARGRRRRTSRGRAGNRAGGLASPTAFPFSSRTRRAPSRSCIPAGAAPPRDHRARRSRRSLGHGIPPDELADPPRPGDLRTCYEVSAEVREQLTGQPVDPAPVRRSSALIAEHAHETGVQKITVELIVHALRQRSILLASRRRYRPAVRRDDREL